MYSSYIWDFFLVFDRTARVPSSQAFSFPAAFRRLAKRFRFLVEAPCPQALLPTGHR